VLRQWRVCLRDMACKSQCANVCNNSPRSIFLYVYMCVCVMKKFLVMKYTMYHRWDCRISVNDEYILSTIPTYGRSIYTDVCICCIFLEFCLVSTSMTSIEYAMQEHQVVPHSMQKQQHASCTNSHVCFVASLPRKEYDSVHYTHQQRVYAVFSLK
jgi:hypothetical protein